MAMTAMTQPTAQVLLRAAISLDDAQGGPLHRQRLADAAWFLLVEELAVLLPEQAAELLRVVPVQRQEAKEMMRVSDEHLQYWGRQFVAARIAGTMSFERFMSLPVEERRRALGRAGHYELAASAAERALPDDTQVLHDQHLVDPMRRSLRNWPRPWFMRRKRRKRFRGRA